MIQTKLFSNLYLAKFLDTSAKLFFLFTFALFETDYLNYLEAI